MLFLELAKHIAIGAGDVGINSSVTNNLPLLQRFFRAVLLAHAISQGNRPGHWLHALA